MSQGEIGVRFEDNGDTNTIGVRVNLSDNNNKNERNHVLGCFVEPKTKRERVWGLVFLLICETDT